MVMNFTLEHLICLSMTSTESLTTSMHMCGILQLFIKSMLLKKLNQRDATRQDLAINTEECPYALSQQSSSEHHYSIIMQLKF